MVVSLAEIVAAKLHGSRTASGFVCCGPANDDSDLSLSIIDADDGGSRRLHAPSMHERETRQGNPVMQFVPTRDPILGRESGTAADGKTATAIFWSNPLAWAQSLLSDAVRNTSQCVSEAKW